MQKLLSLVSERQEQNPWPDSNPFSSRYRRKHFYKYWPPCHCNSLLSDCYWREISQQLYGHEYLESDTWVCTLWINSIHVWLKRNWPFKFKLMSSIMSPLRVFTWLKATYACTAIKNFLSDFVSCRSLNLIYSSVENNSSPMWLTRLITVTSIFFIATWQTSYQ